MSETVRQNSKYTMTLHSFKGKGEQTTGVQSTRLKIYGVSKETQDDRALVYPHLLSKGNKCNYYVPGAWKLSLNRHSVHYQDGLAKE